MRADHCLLSQCKPHLSGARGLQPAASGSAQPRAARFEQYTTQCQQFTACAAQAAPERREGPSTSTKWRRPTSAALRSYKRWRKAAISSARRRCLTSSGTSSCLKGMGRWSKFSLKQAVVTTAAATHCSSKREQCATRQCLMSPRLTSLPCCGQPGGHTACQLQGVHHPCLLGRAAHSPHSGVQHASFPASSRQTGRPAAGQAVQRACKTRQGRMLSKCGCRKCFRACMQPAG